MSWSASFRPRSAKTFPDPTSTLVDFRLFVLTGQLLCFSVSSLDQIDVPLRRLNASLRLLLKGVQNIDSCAQLYCRHHTIRVGGIAESKLDYATADAFKWFRILRRTAELDQLQLVAEQFSGPLSGNPEDFSSNLLATPEAAILAVQADPRFHSLSI